jgi:hypothetical protein
MLNKRSTFILIFVLVGSNLISGCISQTDTGNKTTNTRFTIPSNVPTLLSCPYRENETRYIIINPVSNFTIGEIFEINGTTNLNENEIIHYYVYSGVVPLPTNVPTPNYFVTSGDIKIVRVDCKDSRWSFMLDSNNLTPWSHDFFIWVWTNNQSSSLGVHNEAFLITHRPGSGRSWGEVM